MLRSTTLNGAGSSKKRTRIISGCESCRVLHLKCDNSQPCARCESSDIDCVRPSKIRFRHQPKSLPDTELSYSPNQPWLKLPDELHYFDETPSLIQFHEQEPSPSDVAEDVVQDQPGDSTLQELSASPEISQTSNQMGSQNQIQCSSINAQHDHAIYSLAQEEQNPELDHSLYFGHNSIGNDFDNHDQLESGIENLQHSHPNFDHEVSSHDGSIKFNTGTSQEQFHRTHTATSHVSNESPNSVDIFKDFEHIYTDASPFNPREAVLIRNFIDNMALWLDISDIGRHFETVVPRRALHQPVLRYAVFAFSSRHISRFFDYDEIEAIGYHDKCLELLIPVLSAPNENINEDILAAVAILRLYEEMDAYDQQLHLTGTTKILNSVTGFGCSGGLGEAASWLSLRQDIYISLVTQQPLKTNLENYHNSATFRLTDDIAWANKMVFLLAKALSCAFRPVVDADMATLRQVGEEIEDWAESKPSSFEPILYQARNLELQRVFPEIWLLLPFHAVGLQYYHIAKIVLAISTPRLPTSSYASLREGRQIEKTVRNHLLIVIGLATSNEKTENILFTARHALSVWGGVIREQLDRNATVEFLKKMEEKTGWRNTQLIQSLKEQWDEDSDKF